MAKPNSVLTLIRRWLVQRIEPLPPKDEAWCVDCALNNGWTLVVPGIVAIQHLEKHKEADGTVYVNLIGRNIPAPAKEET